MSTKPCANLHITNIRDHYCLHVVNKTCPTTIETTIDQTNEVAVKLRGINLKVKRVWMLLGINSLLITVVLPLIGD